MRTYILFFIGQLFYSCWIRATVAAPVFSQQIDSMTIQLVTFFGALAILLPIVVFHRHFVRVVKSPVFLFVSVLLATIGTVFLGLPYATGFTLEVLSLIGNIFVALGSGCILVLIGEGYAFIFDGKVQRVITLFAIAGAFLLFSIFLPLSKGVALLVAATFPIISVFCLGNIILDKNADISTSGTSAKSDLQLATGQIALQASKGGFRGLLIYIVVLSVPLTFLRMILTKASGALQFSGWVSLYVTTFIIICIVLILEAILRNHKVSAVSIAIVLLVSVSLLIFFFFDFDSIVPSTLLNAGYALFVASFYCYLGSVIISSKQPPFRIFALGCAANTIGLMVGWILGHLVETIFKTPTVEAIMVGLIYAVFFTSIFALSIYKNNLFSNGSKLSIVPLDVSLGFNLGIQMRCAELALTYGLTTREEEVLVLLIRGKSLRIIASELTLSQNTIKTHVAHIYNKLTIHTHEELLACFEDKRIKPK